MFQYHLTAHVCDACGLQAPRTFNVPVCFFSSTFKLLFWTWHISLCHHVRVIISHSCRYTGLHLCTDHFGTLWRSGIALNYLHTLSMIPKTSLTIAPSLETPRTALLSSTVRPPPSTTTRSVSLQINLQELRNVPPTRGAPREPCHARAYGGFLYIWGSP